MRSTKTPKSKPSRQRSENWVRSDQTWPLSVICELWLVWEAGSRSGLALWQCHVSGRFWLVTQSFMHETGHDYRISKCFPIVEQAIAIA
jgi:hypothetical protein